MRRLRFTRQGECSASSSILAILARARRNGLQYLSLGALRPRYTQGHTCVTINFSIRGELDEALRVGRVRDLQRY